MSTDSAPASVAMTVHATLDGWPVDLALSMPPAKLGAALARLAELGYTPRAAAAPAPSAPAVNQGPPCCPLHGTAKVKESERRPGSYYCAAKLPDGGYCKEKPI